MTLLLLQSVDPLRGFGLVEVGIEGLRIMRLFRQGFEVGCLGAGHGFVARHPILRILDLVGAWIGTGLLPLRQAYG